MTDPTAINLGHYEPALISRALIALDEREGLGTVPPRIHRAFRADTLVTIVTTPTDD